MEIATSRLRYWVGLVCLFVAFLWVFLAAWAVVPAAFGWRPVVIGGDSMGPTIGAGDVVVTAPHDGSPLGPGTVITYKDPARPGLVTHRIVAVQTDGFYLTKGDGNPVADSTPIDPAEVTGVGRILVPVVGLPFLWAYTADWLPLFLWTALIVGALWFSRWAFIPPVRPTARPGPMSPETPTSSHPRRGQQAGPRLGRVLGRGGTTVMLAVVLLLSVGQGPADAALTSTTANTANALTADTLQPPTGLTAAASGSDIQLDWTATPDTYAAGYNIYRSTTQGCCYTFLDSVVGQATVTYTDVGAGAPATVAPAYESIATATRNNAGTSLVINKPAGTVQDDLLIGVVSTDLEDDEPENFNNPAGWTLIGKRNTSGSTGLAQTGVWYRVAGASEPATYTFTWDTDGDAVGAVIRYSGVDTANPIDAWANDRGSSINPIAPDITTTVANTTVLRVFGSDDDDLPVPPTDVHPPSTTGRYELQTTGGESTTGAGADTTQATAGSTGTATFTLAGSEKWVAFTIALTPEPATPTTYYYVTEAYYQNWTSVYSNEAKANMVAILDAWTTGTTHAVSAGDDRLLLVGVYGEDSGAISSIADVTWGGQTLTPIGEATVGTGYSNLVWLGYLDESGITAATGSTIVATWSGTTPDTAVLYAAVTLSGVDQTTPTGNSSTGTATNASTVQPASALNVTGSDMAVYVTGSGAQGQSHTPASGYIEGTEEDSGGLGMVASNATKAITNIGSEQPIANWINSNNRLGIVAVVINAAL